MSTDFPRWILEEELIFMSLHWILEEELIFWSWIELVVSSFELDPGRRANCVLLKLDRNFGSGISLA